jgi:hypothetical protein
MIPNDVGRHGRKTREMIFILGLNHDPRYLVHKFLAMLHRRLDWYALRLPDYLIPVYYLLRPCSYIWRRVPQLIRYIGGRGPAKMTTHQGSRGGDLGGHIAGRLDPGPAVVPRDADLTGARSHNEGCGPPSG